MEWSNDGNGGNGGTAERMADGKMAEMDTYVLFMVHADTGDDTDDDTSHMHFQTVQLNAHVATHGSGIQ